MPKIRVIDTNFWNDPDVARLSRDERLLLVAMITTCADDYGRLMAHAPYLRKMGFGYDDDVTVDDVQAMRDHIVETCQRNVVLYSVDGQEYIWLRKFQKHQKIRYQVKSILPEPPTETTPSQEIAANCRKSPKDSVGLGSVVLSSVEEGSVDAVPAPLQKLRSALLATCQLNPTTIGHQMTRRLCTAADTLSVAGAEPEAVIQFGEWWAVSDWRGKKGEAPRPENVCDEWGKFQAGSRRKGKIKWLDKSLT